MQLRVPKPAQILYVPARYKALYGGRGSAKSTSMADALIIKCYQEETRALCCREIQKSLQMSVHQLLCDRIKVQGLQAFYHITERGIFGANGSKILFAGLRNNPDVIKSIEGLKIAWVEEADRVSQRSFDILTPTLRTAGSEMWCSWNRRFVTDPVDNMFLGGKPPPNSLVAEMNWRDNPFFPDVLREEMNWLKSRNRDKWLHVWEGQPIQRSDARVFPHFEVDDLDKEMGIENLVGRFGADWGMAHPTVLVKIYRKDRKLYIREEAYKVGATIDETPALFAGHDVRKPPRWRNTWGHKGISGVMKGRIIGDSSHPQSIKFLKDRGFSIIKAIKGPGSIQEGIEFMQSCDIIVHPDCTHAQDELFMYKYKIDDITDEVLPELDDKDNHVIDAIRYALESERRGGSNNRISLHAPRQIDL